MKKPSETQRKILMTAAGLANYSPFGRSQHGGWSGALTACHRNGWLNRDGITTSGLVAIGRAAYIILTVADHDANGFVSLAATDLMLDNLARDLIARVDALVEPVAEPSDDASFSFILDLMRPNGDCEDTGKRLLPLQVAMRLAPDAVSEWLSERPEPDAVFHRKPVPFDIERMKEAS